MRRSAHCLSVAFAGIMLSLAFAGPGMANTPENNDVRVLIDISGSMRKNDPENLRRPALRMLAGLLQPGTRAGVWTFAKWANPLVPVAEVDAGWRKRVQSLTKQIASPGQFTNIEEVLDKASADWKGEPVTHARHLVLLTDGMVDVSRQADRNAESRARVLESLLPRLQAAGVQVHTIALSERADHDLMQKLATETGGWYQQVEAADELQRVFLRMFEKVGTPDTVPLEDNRFVVDGSVNEATVVLFSKPDSDPVVLISPSGESYTDSDLIAGVAWSRDQGYDMITIASPQKGEWRLQAEIDPDNRVMIVTDLRLQTSEVPTHIAAGEQARIEASLSNRGELVTRQAFLRLIDVRAESKAGDARRDLPLNDVGEQGDEKGGDGRYTMRFGEEQAREEVELLVAVDSPTFMREKRFRLVVHEPVSADVVSGSDGILLNARVQSAVMQPGARLTAWQEAADGKRIPVETQSPDPGHWSAVLPESNRPVFVKASGTTRLGNLIERTLGPLMPPGVPVPVPPVEAAPEPAPVEKQPEKVEEEAAVISEPEPQEEQGWLVPVLIFGGFNLVLLIAAGVWYFLVRRRGGGPDELDLDQLMETQLAAPDTGDGQATENAA